MKFSDVIRELENNPEKEFQHIDTHNEKCVIKTDEDYYIFKIYNSNGNLIESTRPGGGFNENLNIYFNDWEEVRRSVSWQEAIQAWIEGKTICVQEHTLEYTYTRDKNQNLVALEDGLPLHISELKTGTWYIL